MYTLHQTLLRISINENEMAGACRTHAYKILAQKHEGRKPLGRPIHRSEDNIKMDLREIWCKDVDWIRLAQDKEQ